VYSILYVDDEPAFLDIAGPYLKRSGDLQVDTSSSAKQALKMLHAKKYDAIISDYQMPAMNGIELLKRLRKSGDSIPFIIFTGRSREEIVIQALNEGADFYLQKGADAKPQFVELEHKVKQAIERRRTEQALRESEIRFRELARLLPQIVFECDVDLNLTFVNEPAFRLMGYTPADLYSGINVLDAIDPSQHHRLKENMYRLVRGEPVTHQEYTMVRRDGSTFPSLIYASPIFKENRNAGFRGVVVDIGPTRQKDDYRKILVQLLDNAPEAISVHDFDGNFLYVNQKAIDIHGYSREEYLSLNLHSLDAPGTREKIAERMRILEEKGETSFEVEHIRKDGSVVPLLVKAKYADWGGKKVILSIATDMSGRKGTEVWNREADTRATIDSFPIPSFVIDNDHRITIWNRALAELSGIPADAVIGTRQHWRAFYRTERDCLADLLADNRIGDIEELYSGKWAPSKLIPDAYEVTDFFPYIGENGRWLYFTAAIIRGSDGHNIGVAETLEDITERIVAEEALSQTNKKLNLLSNITRHDILNQITVLMGAAALLHEEALSSGERMEFLDKIDTSTSIIRRHIEFTREYQDIGIDSPTWQALDRIIARTLDQFDLSHIDLDLDLPEVEIYADPLLEKVFYNLIHNSLVHGQNVTRISIQADENPYGLAVRVSDNGSGIAHEKKEEIFKRGFGKNTRFGLFLAREILDITGIGIREIGIEGEGACFELSVPRAGFRRCNGNDVS
jgi:PAS domain S-box-containing protein